MGLNSLLGGDSTVGKCMNTWNHRNNWYFLYIDSLHFPFTFYVTLFSHFNYITLGNIINENQEKPFCYTLVMFDV